MRKQTPNSTAFTATIAGKTINVLKFRSLRSAKNFARGYINPVHIMAGDHGDLWGEFWLCQKAEAAKLKRAGYEIIR